MRINCKLRRNFLFRYKIYRMTKNINCYRLLLFSKFFGRFEKCVNFIQSLFFISRYLGFLRILAVETYISRIPNVLEFQNLDFENL